MTLERTFKEFSKQKPNAPRILSGILGMPGSNAVQVPGRDGFVYVRLRDNPNEVIQAFNDKVSPVVGLPVLLQRESNRYHITGRDLDRYGNWGNDSSGIPRHGNQHSFNIAGGGGSDVTWVYSQQFMPLLVMPSGTSGAGNVIINEGVYFKETDWKVAGGTGTSSLLSYKPSGANNAKMVVVYLNSNTGNFGTVAGNEFSAGTTGTWEVVPYLPNIPDTASIPLAGVRLVTGTSAITWNNLYDLRPWVVADAFISTGTISRASVAESHAGTNNLKAVTPAGLPVRIVNEAMVRNDTYGGNARGAGAIDLQRTRSGATQIAGGTDSVILGGRYNTIQPGRPDAAIIGSYSSTVYGRNSVIHGGYYSTIHGDYNVLGGYYGTISGTKNGMLGGAYNGIYADNSFIGGGGYNKILSTASLYGNNSGILSGKRNKILARYASVIGGLGAYANIYAEISHAAGYTGGYGTRQHRTIILSNKTTDATATELFSSLNYGTLAGNIDRLQLPDDTTWAFSIIVSARRTDTNDESGGWKFEGVIDRNAGAGTTALVGTPVKTVLAKDTAAWDVNVSADTTNGSLKISVTGEASKTILWVAVTDISQAKG